MAATPLQLNAPAYSPVTQFSNSLNASYLNVSSGSQGNVVPQTNATTPLLQKTPPTLNRNSKWRAILTAVLISAAVLAGPYWMVDRTRPATMTSGVVSPPALVYVPARAEQRIVWDSLLKIGSRKSSRRSGGVVAAGGGAISSSAVRIMFLGDSITEGGAANTTHPRKHPNGSCSFRFSFLSHIATRDGGHSRITADSPTQPSAAAKKRLSPHQVTTVGPFSSNCGDAVVPDKCFATLRRSWGNDKSLALYDSSSKSINWRRHAAVSGVTALGLIRHREAWPKRETCYAKSGILTTPPTLPPAVTAMEGRYRRIFPDRVNVSDVAVWGATYEPHLVVVLIGTNDLRWGRDWTEVLYESIPAVLHEVLWAADRRVSPLLSPRHSTYPADAATPLSDPAVIGRHYAPPSKTSQQPSHPSQKYTATVCPTFAVVSTLFPRTAFATELEAFNMALLAMQRRRQLGTGVMCPTPDAFLTENALMLMPGETFLLCHPCLRIIDGGAPVVEAAGATMSKNDFIEKYTFDGLHPNDEGDEQLGRRMAKLLMDL
jgi:hypothetical protein